ncbi:MAG: hypothetical protein OHK006_01400 [Thermodesulfovibrionales bacterium]
MTSGRILVVDDEQIALKNLEHVLNKEGYEVVSTQSGQNALKLFEEQSFDLVVTDLKMERVDGLQILKRCKELNPDIEVVMITGYASIQSAIQVMKKGAYAGKASARDPGKGSAQAGRHRTPERRCPHRSRDEPEHPGCNEGREVPAGPVLPPERRLIPYSSLVRAA